MNKGRRGNESIPRRIRKESLPQAGNQTQASTASSRKALRGRKSQKSFFRGNGSLQIDHLGDPLSVWGKSQTLHYIAAQPSRTRLFVKSKIFKRQFLPTFATRCKLSIHWCLKSRHSSCWDPPTFPTGVGYCGALQPPQAKTPQNPLWHFCAS